MDLDLGFDARFSGYGYGRSIRFGLVSKLPYANDIKPERAP